MGKPIVFDVETKHSFREVQNNTKKLGVSVAVCYDYATNLYHAFTEERLPELFGLFEKASVIVGFNSDSFDLVVLSPYYVGDLFSLTRFDILENIKERAGRRYSLDDLVKATLGKGKTGHGLQAIEFYRSGKIDELISYCRADVELTKELLDFGLREGYVFSPASSGKSKIFVNWRSLLEKKNSQTSKHNLTLGF